MNFISLFVNLLHKYPLQGVLQATLLAQRLQLRPRLIQRNHYTLLLRRRVITVADVDCARLLFLGTDHYKYQLVNVFTKVLTGE